MNSSYGDQMSQMSMETRQNAVVSSSNDNTNKAKDEFKRKQQQLAEQENTNLWQHPYVDVLKHFKLLPGSDFKLNKKAGDVNEYFVSTSNFTHNYLIGQGNRQESDQHRRFHLCEQLRAVASPILQYQGFGTNGEIHLFPGEKPASWTAIQLPYRLGHGGEISWDQDIYQ